MLRKTYAALEEIPEPLRDHYTDTGNGYQLQVETGDSPAIDLARYREMRDNNIKMKAQLEELTTEQQQIRDQYTAMIDKAQGDEEAALLKQGQFDQVLERRTQAIKSEYQRQLEDLHAQREQAEADKQAARQRFGSVYLGEQMATALERKKLRLRPTARADLLTRAGGTFEPNDALDALVAKNDIVGERGEALTMDEWLDRTVTEAPHLFDGGDGGGATPGGGVGGGMIRMQDVQHDPVAFLQASEKVARGEAKWSE